MNVAGRKIVVSISMPGSPGCSSSSAVLDAARHLQRVRPRELLDDEHAGPGPSLMTASPISGWWSVTTLADVAQAERRCRPRSTTGTWARLVRRRDRQHVADAQALVRRVDEPAGADDGALGVLQQPGVERVGGGVHHLVERDAVARRARPGRPGRGAAASRSPQIATFATPGTRSSRARIFQ